MILEIIRHTPVWVWAVLAKLVAVGLWQTRARKVGVLRVTVLPLVMIALSLGGVLSVFGHLPAAIGGWAAGVGAALAFGRNLVTVPGAHWSPRTAALHVPGSWLPLTLVLVMFAIKYACAVSLALHPPLATDTAFVGAFCLGVGSLSGLFLARSLSLRRLAPRTSAPGSMVAWDKIRVMTNPQA